MIKLTNEENEEETENDDDDEAEEAGDDDDEEEDDGIRYSPLTPNSNQVEPTTSGGIEVRRRNPVRSFQIKTQQKRFFDLGHGLNQSNFNLGPV